MANRFWVGGTGTWDASSTANWSATTGGAAGASAPTSGDVAIFNSLSGSGVCSTVSGAVCSGLTLSASTMEVNLGSDLTASGTLAFSLGTLTLNSYSLSCTTVSGSGTGVRAINFGTGNINVTGNGATVINITTSTNFTYTGEPNVNFSYSGSTGTRTLSYGGTGATETNALNLNVTAGTDIIAISNASRIKSLNFTGFGGSLNNNTRTVFGNLTVSAEMTLTAGTSATTFAATSGTQQITINGKTLDFPLTFNGVGGAWAFQDALTQGSTRAFTITNGLVQLKSGVTSTVGAFVTSGTSQKFLRSTLAGSQATLSQASGTVNATYLTIQDINATGGAIWNARTDLGSKDITNNTGWNFIFIAIQQILKPVMAKILQPIILN